MRPSAILVLVVGSFVVLGPVAGAGGRTPDPERAAKALEKVGGWIDRAEDIPGRPVVGVRFGGPRVTATDKDLENLRALPTLERAYLCETHFTDRGLKHLRGLFCLRELCLYKSQITDQGLRNLEGLTRLRKLSLQGTRVTDKGLVHLKKLTRLRYLEVQNTKITLAGIKNLRKSLPKLNVIR
jgi:hypothetical protein